MSLIEAHVIEAVSDGSPEGVEGTQLAMFWVRMAAIIGEADEKIESEDWMDDPRLQELANLKERAEKRKTEGDRSELDSVRELQKLAFETAETYAVVLREQKGGEAFAKRIDKLIASRK